MVAKRIPLLGGAYQSRSIISGAQRCINLYPEVNEDPQAPTQVTHYPTPGLTLKGTPPAAGIGRATFRATNGALYTVVGRSVYYVDAQFNYTLIGTLNVAAPTPVSMRDNGIVVLIVDNTGDGYAIELGTNRFGQVTDPNFLGGTRVDYVDTFFMLNVPNTRSWYISLSNVDFDNLVNGVITPPNIYAAFDPLDIAAKSGGADNIVTVIAMRRNPWLIGALTSEVWYNSGAADFTFAAIPGVFIEHGNVAPYSIAKQDLSTFWLHQDEQGKAIVIRGNADFSTEELSSKAIEAIISAMPVISDAIGGCFQQNGHAFYVLTFPTANRTFAVELKTKQWHELAWTDANGQFNRHRANAWCFAYGLNLVIDWQNGNLYELDPTNFTDFGGPIVRLRTIPHVIADGYQVRADFVIADLQGGTLGSATPDNPPKVYLRTSVDRGGTYGDPQEGVFGAAGDYGQFPAWRNQGLARDFVFEVSWSEPINTVLNGLFFDATKANN